MLDAGWRAFPDPTSLPENPLSLLGLAAKEGALTVWTAAMAGLWSAGLWLLRLAFTIIDALTTPDMSADGPLRGPLQTTLWIGASVAGLLLLLQLGVVVLRRDGKSLARLLLGLVQFGFVWLSFLAVAAGAVSAASALRRVILRTTLGVDALSAITWTEAWPRDVVDAATATVLGVTSLCLVIPGAFFHMLVALVSLAAWLVLISCMPLTAAGLMHETARGWFWKSLRWSVACVLIAPCEALVFGIGVRVTQGVLVGAGGDVEAVGAAVVGAGLVMIGACCPLALFRLLAFVDPATPSGAAVRQTWKDAGDSLQRTPAGSQMSGGPATATSSDGRARGEQQAETQGLNRFSGALGAFGQGVRTTTAFATRATDLAADILGAAGVGAASYSMTPADERALRAQTRPKPGANQQGQGPEPPAGGPAPTSAPGAAPLSPPGPRPPGGVRTSSAPGPAAGGAGAGGAAAVPPV